MPLLQRQIQPRYLGRQQLDESVRTDLQATFVNSLSGVMRQLGSLSKHAEDLLSQVVGEIQKVKRKADSLNSRIERAAQRVLQLNPLEEQGETWWQLTFYICGPLMYTRVIIDAVEGHSCVELIPIVNCWATTQLLVVFTSRTFQPRGLCQLLTR